MNPIAIAMITTDRAKNHRKNYIFDTLRSLEKSGVFTDELYDSLTIFVDGPSVEYSNQIQKATSHLPSVEVKKYTDSEGSAGNALRAHQHLSFKRDKWAMVIEDDIEVCHNFLSVLSDWMEKAYSANRIVYQIGVWYEYVDRLASSSSEVYFDFFGHNEKKPKVFSNTELTTHMRGSQCYLMESQHCQSFVSYLENLKFELQSTSLIHHDMRIRHWLNGVAKKTGDIEKAYLRSPKPKTFVQHIGKESSVYTVKKHIDPWFHFIGEDNG